jgi:flagellar protein FlaG
MSNEISGFGAQRVQVQNAVDIKKPKVETPVVTLGTGKPSVEETAKATVKVDAKEQMEKLQEAVERINEQMRRNNYNLAFSVDKKADAIVVQVKNLESGDVIRQIPNETALRVAHHLEDIKGLLQDKSV